MRTRTEKYTFAHNVDRELAQDRRANPTPIATFADAWGLVSDQVEEWLFFCRLAREIPEAERTPNALRSLGLAEQLVKLAAVARRIAEDLGKGSHFEEALAMTVAAHREQFPGLAVTPHGAYTELRAHAVVWISHHERCKEAACHNAYCLRLAALAQATAEDLGLWQAAKPAGDN